MDLSWEGDEPAAVVAEEEPRRPLKSPLPPLRRSSRSRPLRLRCLKPA
jgi:hypothetical protein